MNGEHKRIPISVYGHPSRVRIPALTHVPYLEIEEGHSRNQAVRVALQELLRYDLPTKKKKSME